VGDPTERTKPALHHDLSGETLGSKTKARCSWKGGKEENRLSIRQVGRGARPKPIKSVASVGKGKK